MSFSDLIKKFDKRTEAVYTESVGVNMDKHTEIIFNLFIIKYFKLRISTEDNYNWFTKNSRIFKIFKSCFPKHEIACQSLVSGNYEIDFPCNLIYDKALIIKARKKAKYNKKTKNWEL